MDMEDPPPPNLYKTLNVPKDATLATIRSAHRKLVLSCHPDKVQDESVKMVKAEQFHQVQQAYEILSDEKRRLRYDEKIKLDELRAEMANDRPPPLSRRATEYSYGSSRGGPPPMPDMRERPIYQTREPKSTRYSDDDYPSSRYDSRPSNSYDDYYPKSSTRRTSGRASEEKRKARDYEDERELRRKERESEAYARDQRTKRRDMDKKRNTQTKSKSKYPDIDDGSDSEVEPRRYPSKREIPTRPSRYEDLPVRSREEPRRNEMYDRELDDVDLYSKMKSREEHMNKTREAVEIEPRHPGRSRAASTLDARPPIPTVEPIKRPSVQRRHGSRQISPIRSSKREKRSPEIVDPPSSRKPSLPVGSSDPKGLKKGLFGSSTRKEPQRSQTYQDTSPDPRYQSMRRSETMPLKSSNLKNMKASSNYSDTSSSDSDETEVLPTPISRPSLRPKMTSYRVHNDENVVVEPQEYASPKTRRSSDYPNVIPRGSPTATRTPPMPRSTSYAFPQEERSSRPAFNRTESTRPTPSKSHQSSKLFGTDKSQVEDAYTSRRSPNHYPEENGRYAKPYGRKGSEDVDRDAFPGSNFRQPRHMERSAAY